MDVPSIVLLLLVILWALWAVWYLLRHGACGCGGKKCCGSGKNCGGCHRQK